MIRRHFPADRAAQVLDLGCGHGALLRAAADLGYRNVRGVDGSPEQVAAARQFGVAVEEGEIWDFLRRCESQSLDVVVTFDVIEHLTREETAGLVDEIKRVLRPAGRWVIHVPNAESLFGSRIRYADITHETAYTSASIAQLLMSSGFDRVSCFEDTPAVHGVISAGRWCLWHTCRLILRFYLSVETGTSDGAIFSQNLLAVATTCPNADHSAL